MEVEARAAQNENGQFLDANTGKPIDGPYDLGHKAGHEFRTEQAQAEQEGITQEQFNDKMNNPDLYQIEDPSINRSHQFEATEINNDIDKTESNNTSGTANYATEKEEAIEDIYAIDDNECEDDYEDYL